MFHFYTPIKRQKTKGSLTFSGGIEMKHWAKIGYINISIVFYETDISNPLNQQK